jgi:uncharacterized protein with PIN domain
MYNPVIQGKKVNRMSERTRTEDPSGKVQIEVTRCPECGTEWETVVTRRREARNVEQAVQW